LQFSFKKQFAVSFLYKWDVHFTFYFTVQKQRVGLLVGFIVFFSGLLKTTGDLFWLVPITSTLKIIMDV